MANDYGKNRPLHRVMVRQVGSDGPWVTHHRCSTSEKAQEMVDALHAKDANHEYRAGC
jgi:hypothetical protein